MVVLVGGERCERGIVGGKFLGDGLFIGGRVGNVVKVGVKLVEHGVWEAGGR